jgi:CheY-like chemotaxis protein
MLQYDDNCKIYNIILADDEKLIRQTNSRIIKSLAKEMNLNINIIESEDGVETLYLVHKFNMRGETISCIISDESMNLLNGVNCAEMLNKLLDLKGNKIPYFILTAYENLKCESNIVKAFEVKPMDKQIAKRILNVI